MKRHKVIGAAITALVLVGGYMFYGQFQEQALADEDFSAWKPNANEILGRIGTLQKPISGIGDAERRRQFCLLFQKRFRGHEPAVAVGMRFVQPTRIKLMCPARMEPWRMDSIAMLAWRESRAAFGKPCVIDIYETFIGTKPLKIGELNMLSENPDVAHIAYHYEPNNPDLGIHRLVAPEMLVQRDVFLTPDTLLKPGRNLKANRGGIEPRSKWTNRRPTGSDAALSTDTDPSLHLTSHQGQP